MRGGISTELVIYPLYLYEFSEYFQSHKFIRMERKKHSKVWFKEYLRL